MIVYFGLIFLVSLLIVFYFRTSKFQNFELKDRRSIADLRHKLRKYGTQVPPPYPNGWFAIEQSRNIKPGTAKNVDCLGENFVVFRSKTNEVFVLDAYCPHMGANIGIGGKVKGNCVECPFHQWRFSGETGECVDIPYSESCDDVKKQAKLRKWISKEVNDFIYVWYHAEDEEPWELPDFNLKNIKLTLKLRMHTHVQDFFENAVDIAHFSPVHGASVFAGVKPNESFIKFPSLVNQTFEVIWSPDPKIPSKCSIDVNYFNKFLNRYVLHSVTMVSEIHGPGIKYNHIKSSLGSVFCIASVKPIDPTSFLYTQHFYSSFWLGLFAKYIGWSVLINLARDKRIWDSKKYQKNLLLVKEEKMLKDFKVWFSKFYSPNSKTYEEAKNNLDW